MNIIPIIPVEELVQPSVEVIEPTFIARTSDRSLFKRCRRLWGWTSINMQGRKMRQEADYFWFGTGVHFALEDFHGLNNYQHPALAFYAYSLATQAIGRAPANYRELELLGMGIMSYYGEVFLRNRDPLQTYVHNGVPQCEVNGRIDLGVHINGKRMMYGFTLDRVAIDEYGRLWIVEYKTAKSFRVYHLDTDDQITAYCWAAQRYYGREVAGVVYQQHKKTLPVMPKILSTGKVSHDKRQSTTAHLYGEMLKQIYGEIGKAPYQNTQLYSHLLMEEDEDSDRFIHRQRVERNQQQLQSFEEQLLMELEDMSNPDLPLYKNPTKDCAWGCPLQAACIAMDDGGDWMHILNSYTFEAKSVAEEQTKWRRHLPTMEQINLPLEALQYQQLAQRLEVQFGLESQPESQQGSESPTEVFLQELGML